MPPTAVVPATIRIVPCPRRSRARRSLAALLGLAAAIALTACRGAPGDDRQPLPEAPAVAPEAHAAQVQAWRETHEQNYRYEYVSIAGLHFLPEGTRTIGSDPSNDIVVERLPAVAGRLVVEGERVRFEPASDVAVVRKGSRTRPQPGQPPDEPVTGPIVLKEPGPELGPEIAIGGVRLVVHTGGSRLSLRVRDPQGEPARAFTGFAWFPVDPAYRVGGRFVPDARPQDVQVLNTFNDPDTYTTEGVVEFELHGERLRLRPFTTRPRRFYFVFRDASSGHETYKTARFLYADLLDDGTTVLDFNQAFNPPCAFNQYTTCPLPLPENILPVEVLAGERLGSEAEVADRR
jgi:uncharacterized protein